MRVLLILLLTLSFGYFLTGGFLMIAAPDGNLIHLPLTILDNTAFRDFKAPGYIMLFFFGPMLALTIRSFLMKKKRRYEWSIASGIFILLWTLLQFMYSGTTIWIDLFLFAVSLFIVLISLQIRIGSWVWML
jgi:hypothetical protein